MANLQQRSLLSSATDIWDRSGSDTLSRRAFLGLIGGLTFYGLALNAALATWAMQIHFQPGLVLMLVLAIGLPMAGIFTASRAKSMPVALLGYHLLLIPMGLILGPILSVYISIGGMPLVTRALMLTGCTAGVMTLLGLSYPNLFAKLGGVLFGALLALVVLRLVSLFVPSLAAAGWIEWLAAGIFTLYIGYDCYRAMSIPATSRNAVDVAISLYLDIYNLFLTILRLLSRRD
jgi:FtsH-binding integral membrane protein